MRVWQLTGGFGLEHLQQLELEPPTPGPGEVLLRMRAASLNYRDLLTVTGAYNPRLRMPLIPLSDGVGEVLALGPGVQGLRVGDRACPLFVQDWEAGPPTLAGLRSTLGGPLDGVMAETRVFPARGVVVPPAHLSDEEAACLPCAALTAWSALITQGRLQPGQTVLVQGTGGVSLFAAQLARLAGARVLITSSSDDKLARALALGAHAGLNYRQTPAWGAWARQQSGGEGVDHVVEVGGAGTLEQSVLATRPGGTIHLIGVLSGVRSELLLTRVLMQNIRVQGVIVGNRQGFEAMARAIDLHALRPVLDRSFGWDELPAALEHLASGTHLGKITLRLGRS